MPKTRRAGYRNVVRHRPRTVHTVAGSMCIRILPLIRHSARRGFGGARLRAATLARQRCTTPRITSEVSMLLLFWPIYLTARITTWLTRRTDNAAMKEAAWVNAVAAEQANKP